MFAPKAATAHTKTSDKSPQKIRPLLERQVARSAARPTQILEPAIREQAMIPPFARGARDRSAGQPDEQLQSGPSWNFANILIFPPGHDDRRPERLPLSAAPFPGVLQRKLQIGAVDDPLEHEADCVADQVMRTPTPPRASTVPTLSSVAGVQAKAAVTPAPHLTPVVEANVRTLQNEGNPLPSSSREFFESQLRADFRQVRVNTSPRAQQTAQLIGAKAFTVGQSISFGAGQYAPESNEGKYLLAHELAHVVQQGGGIRSVDTPLQRSATSEVLQRQPATQQAKPEIKFRYGWLTDGGPVETYEQLAGMARLAIATLEDVSDVESDAVKTQVTEWIALVKWWLPYFDKHAGEKVDPAYIPSINEHFDELVKIREAIDQDKLVQIKEAMWREHAAALKAAEEAEALQPALDDALRAAYRKGSSKTVKDAVSTVKGAISVGRSLRTLAAGITEDIMGLPLAKGTKMSVDLWTSQIGTPKVTIINIGKYTEKLGTLGRILSGLNIVLTIADRSKKATVAEQDMKDLSDAVGIGTDLISASPLSAPPHFSLYSTLYLKPALKIISKQIGVLVENLSDVNRVSVEVTGDLMYPNAEPGGQKMFDFMVKVMHAKSESGFPALPSDVETYLVDHREKLSAGAEADVPTEGMWWWKSLDGLEGRRWLFANRQRVWAMFYGSMKVPDGKH